jgi:hypothetical protein
VSLFDNLALADTLAMADTLALAHGPGASSQLLQQSTPPGIE